ncbi:MAG: hypothetical protein R2795_26010 [Saprospiraceae bacterium]
MQYCIRNRPQPKPDIVLLDHEIKGNVKGIALGQQIKPLNIPILYMTAFDNDTNYGMPQSNMIGYLVKPIGKKAFFPP